MSDFDFGGGGGGFTEPMPFQGQQVYTIGQNEPAMFGSDLPAGGPPQVGPGDVYSPGQVGGQQLWNSNLTNTAAPSDSFGSPIEPPNGIAPGWPTPNGKPYDMGALPSTPKPMMPMPNDSDPEGLGLHGSIDPNPATLRGSINPSDTEATAVPNPFNPSKPLSLPAGLTAGDVNPPAKATASSSTSAPASSSATDYMLQNGGHYTVGLQRSDTPPPGVTYNSDLANRMQSAGHDYEQATGQKPQFGEMARDRATQAEYYRRYQNGTGGLAAKPGNSRHEQGNAVDIPHGPFLDWMHQNGGKYGVSFPYANDTVHAQLANGKPNSAALSGQPPDRMAQLKGSLQTMTVGKSGLIPDWASGMVPDSVKGMSMYDAARNPMGRQYMTPDRLNQIGQKIGASPKEMQQLFPMHQSALTPRFPTSSLQSADWPPITV
jgi:hypothetical protein